MNSVTEKDSAVKRTIDFAGLRKVIAAVEKSPAHDWGMGSWQCGTKRCAIGWFCAMNPDDDLKLVDSGACTLKGVHSKPFFYYEPSFLGLRSFMAVAYRFGLRVSEAEDLFGFVVEVKSDGSKRDPHKNEFLENIEQFIVENEPTTC